MGNRKAKTEHIELRNALGDVLKDYSEMSAIEVLAVASQLVGSLMALQDESLYSQTSIKLAVERNIEMGREAAIRSLING
jgi:hypothetical protein